MPNVIPSLIAAAVALGIVVFWFVRLPLDVEWPRSRFTVATAVSVVLFFWPVALPAIFRGILPAIVPGLFVPIALGAIIGFFAGNAMPIAQSDGARKVRIHTTSPIMDLIAGVPLAGPAIGSLLRAYPSIAIIADFGGLAFSTAALAALYIALNRNLFRNPDPEFFSSRDTMPSGGFSVELTRVGARKVHVVKALRGATGMSLGDAYLMTRRVPSVVLEGADEVRAVGLRDQLEAAGANATIVKTHAQVELDRYSFCEEDA